MIAISSVRKLSEDEQKQLNESKKRVFELADDIKVLEIELQKERSDKAKEQKEKELRELREFQKDRNEINVEFHEENLENEKKERDKRFKEEREAINQQLAKEKIRIETLLQKQEQERLKTLQETEKLNQKKIQTESANLRLAQQIEKQNQKRLQQEKFVSQEYKRQSQELNDLIARYQELSLPGSKIFQHQLLFYSSCFKKNIKSRWCYISFY